MMTLEWRTTYMKNHRTRANFIELLNQKILLNNFLLTEMSRIPVTNYDM